MTNSKTAYESAQVAYAERLETARAYIKGLLTNKRKDAFGVHEEQQGRLTKILEELYGEAVGTAIEPATGGKVGIVKNPRPIVHMRLLLETLAVKENKQIDKYKALVKSQESDPGFAQYADRIAHVEYTHEKQGRRGAFRQEIEPRGVYRDIEFIITGKAPELKDYRTKIKVFMLQGAEAPLELYEEILEENLPRVFPSIPEGTTVALMYAEQGLEVNPKISKTLSATTLNKAELGGIEAAIDKDFIEDNITKVHLTQVFQALKDQVENLD